MDAERTPTDAFIVCDTGVNGDDVVSTMLASGLWKRGPVEFVAGKRIQNLIPTDQEVTK